MSHNIFRNRRDLGPLVNISNIIGGDYRRYTPKKQYLIFTSVQSASINQVSITLRVDSGKSTRIYWGDGTSVSVIGSGSNTTYTSSYSVASTTYTIYINGDIGYIRRFEIQEPTVNLGNFLTIKNLIGLQEFVIVGVAATSINLNYLPISLTLVNTASVSNIIWNLDSYINITNILIQGSNAIVSGSLTNKTSLTNIILQNSSSITVTGSLTGLTSLVFFTSYVPNVNYSGSITNCILLTTFVMTGSNNSTTGGSFTGINGLTLVAFNGTSLTFSGTVDLSNCSSLTGVQITSNAGVTAISNPTTSSIISTYYCFTNNLTSLDLSTLSNIGSDIRGYSNSGMVSFSLPILNRPFGVIDLHNCALDLTSVNSILSKLNVYFSSHTPTSSLNVNLSGGTNSSPTGGSSNTDKVNIESIFFSAGRIATITVN